MSRVISFAKIPKSQWNAIFGSDDEIRARRAAHKNAEPEPYNPIAPAIRTGNERIYKVRHDPGLGCGYNSRQERDAILKKKGKVCVG